MQLTFVDEVGSQLENLDIRNNSSSGKHVSDGHASRQLVPGLLYIDTDKNQTNKVNIDHSELSIITPTSDIDQSELAIVNKMVK